MLPTVSGPGSMWRVEEKEGLKCTDPSSSLIGNSSNHQAGEIVSRRFYSHHCLVKMKVLSCQEYTLSCKVIQLQMHYSFCFFFDGNYRHRIYQNPHV